MNDSWTAPVTVNLLTGFLGAGKTSLLKRLLRRPDLADTAVLINEFGDVGLDHLLVEEVDEDVVLLASGCVCCTIRGDLKEALMRLHGRRQRGDVPPFTRLVIETTGLADPAPIMATFVADPMFRHHFRVGNIVVVVDAENGFASLDAYEESLRQVAVADRLVVTKIDLAAPDKVAQLVQRLTAINPTSEITTIGEDDEAAAQLLTDDVHDAATRSEQVARWLAGETGDDDHHHDHVDRNRHGTFRAMLLSADEPIDWAAFALWLSMLLHRHGAEILRVKGLLSIAGQSAPVVVQGVQHLIHKPVHLDRWPDGRAQTRIVVIVRGLDPELIRRSFSVFMRLGARSAAPQALSSA